MTDDTNLHALAEITSEVVAAYVAKNSVQVTELPRLVQSVHEAFKNLGQPVVTEVAPEPLKPAVPIRKSVTDDYIIMILPL